MTGCQGPVRKPCVSCLCPSRVLGHSSEQRDRLGSPRLSPSVGNPGHRSCAPALPGAATGGRHSGPALKGRAHARETGQLARTPRSVAVYPTDADSSPPSRGRGEAEKSRLRQRKNRKRDNGGKRGVSQGPSPSLPSSQTCLVTVQRKVAHSHCR